MMKKIIITCMAAFLNLLSASADKQELNVLVFSKSTDYYHEAVPHAIKAFYEMGRANQWRITFTEDSTFFTKRALKKYNVVVFLLTGGDILNDSQKKAFQKFIQNGGGFVGVHSATTTEYNWPWYGQLIGAYFTGHPPVHDGILTIENRDHIATRHYTEDTLKWKDEWYSFDKNPRAQTDVLISIDEKTYNVHENIWSDGLSLVMGDHPLVWCHEFDGGRSFQTALGHLPEMYEEENFRKHLTGAVVWASGTEE